MNDSFNQANSDDSSSDDEDGDAGDDSSTTDTVDSPDTASDQATNPQISTSSNPQLSAPTNGANLDRSGDAIADIAGGNPGGYMYSASGVNYSDGEINLSSTDLSDCSAGSYIGVQRSWTNLHDNGTDLEYGSTMLRSTNGGVFVNQVGYGWAQSDEPQAFTNYKGNLVVQNSAINNSAFDVRDNNIYSITPTTYSSFLDSNDTLTATGSGFIDADSSGNQEVFPEPNDDPPFPGMQNQASELVNSYGTVTTNDYGGSIDDDTDSVQYRDFTVDGVPMRDKIVVTANNADLPGQSVGPATEIDDEIISNYSGESPTTTIRRKANYTYYVDNADSASDYLYHSPYHGDDQQLRSVQITDSGGNVISNEFYVYYTTSESSEDGFVHSDPSNTSSGVIGYPGALKYRFSSQSYDKLLASLPTGTTIDTATDAELAPYADVHLQYNDKHQVSQISLQGQGCSSCGGGIGTYSYTYAQNGYDSGYSLGSSEPDMNAWAHETTETLPDGNTNIVYSNYFGEPILSVYEDTATNPSSPEQWRTAFGYDNEGRVIMEAQPSAVSGSFALPDPDDTSTDLLGYNATTGDYSNNFGYRGGG